MIPMQTPYNISPYSRRSPSQQWAYKRCTTKKPNIIPEGIRSSFPRRKPAASSNFLASSESTQSIGPPPLTCYKTENLGLGTRDVPRVTVMLSMGTSDKGAVGFGQPSLEDPPRWVSLVL